jgi:hypothetical protein
MFDKDDASEKTKSPAPPRKSLISTSTSTHHPFASANIILCHTTLGYAMTTALRNSRNVDESLAEEEIPTRFASLRLLPPAQHPMSTQWRRDQLPELH